MSAVISSCGTYRYELRRRVPCELRWISPLVAVMLNPSTADAETDDPTIRKLRSYARQWRHTELIVVNLFAFRATNPSELYNCSDPLGPDNDKYLQAAIDLAEVGGRLLVAWGNHPLAQEKTLRSRTVLRQCVERLKLQPYCLEINKNGSPKHPLYCRGNLQPVPWNE